MNWFERYGIVGAYFLVLNFWSLLANSFLELSKINKDNSTLIIGIIGVAFLPIGYILSVVSQQFYYMGWGGRQIHIESLKYFSEGLKNKMGISCNDSESIVESKMSAFIRLYIGKERLPDIRQFTTKRFDVRAINLSIIIVTLATLILNLIISFISNISCLAGFSNEYIFIIISLAVLCLLIKSNNLMDEQLIETEKIIFNFMDQESKQETVTRLNNVSSDKARGDKMIKNYWELIWNAADIRRLGSTILFVGIIPAIAYFFGLIKSGNNLLLFATLMALIIYTWKTWQLKDLTSDQVVIYKELLKIEQGKKQEK